MSTPDVSTGPFCSAMGCRGNEATVVIEHEDHGQRFVCDECADGHDVVREVQA